jgi:hypothetical protein
MPYVRPSTTDLTMETHLLHSLCATHQIFHHGWKLLLQSEHSCRKLPISCHTTESGNCRNDHCELWLGIFQSQYMFLYIVLGVEMHSLLCEFPIGLDVHLLQIHICCCKANHATVITLYRVRNCFPLYFVKPSPHQFNLHVQSIHEMSI